MPTRTGTRHERPARTNAFIPTAERAQPPPAFNVGAGAISLYLQQSVNKALKKPRSTFPQSEEVDWSFSVLVRDVVMMGRYGHMGWLRRQRMITRLC